MAKCLFCQSEVDQLINAHVIPAWFYKAHLKGNKNSSGKSETLVFNRNGDEIIRKETSTERRAKMACINCEQLFTIDDLWLKSFLTSGSEICSVNYISISQKDINSAKKFALGFFMRYCGFMLIERKINPEFPLEFLYESYVQSPVAIKLSIMKYNFPIFNNSVPDIYVDMFEEKNHTFIFLNYVFALQLNENQNSSIDDIQEKCMIPIFQRLPGLEDNNQKMVIGPKNFDNELQKLPKDERESFHNIMK